MEGVTLREEPGMEVGSPLAESSERGVGTQEEEGGVRQQEGLGSEGLVPEGVTETEGQQPEGEAEAPGSDPGAESAETSAGEQRHAASSTVLDLGALLSETNMETWGGFAQPLHPGWHFPTGPGLSDVVHCPSWQFPAMSYYPLQEVVPFEVVWRVWESLPGAGSEPEPHQGHDLFEFSVMSYNILAQDLLEANMDLYRHCAPEVLAWEFRFQNILGEFQKWDPDILCLQEVQENHYTEQLRPALSDLGYACVYMRRTGAKTDGCAICYRQSRFSQVSCRLVEFYRPQVEMLHRNNVGVVLLLQPITLQGSEVRVQGPPLCVANTHLLFNPRRGDVKLAQLAILFAEIDNVVKSWRLKGTCCPIILCGDFNSVPNMPLYQFITTGQLYYHGLPAWMISGQEDLSYKTYHRRLFAPLWPSSLGISDSCQFVSGCAREGKESGSLHYDRDFLLQLRFCEAALIRPETLELIPGVTDATPDPLEKQPCIPRFRGTIRHTLKLRSAYSHFISGTNKPEVTTLHSEFGATVDYIFYSAGPGDCGQCGGGGHQQDGGLKLIGRLALLSEEDLWPMKGLPNEIFSSDHLCLLAKFQLDPGHA
ncbi:protein angel homolog 1 isoform X1 [Megalops cyprinoides]|uniref:protein angel homolog 1 isoform X1 n=1 Tax=Megalops cyprinoides TaxID=118141 RepID=UPI001863D363|nr:protein angel homolog 1 isoform X1 [Megalops cyprinoides]